MLTAFEIGTEINNKMQAVWNITVKHCSEANTDPLEKVKACKGKDKYLDLAFKNNIVLVVRS